MNIYIANLHFSVTETELQQLFELYGTVNSVNLIINKKNKKSKGFAFIEMLNETEAKNSIRKLSNKEIRGRQIKLSQAK